MQRVVARYAMAYPHVTLLVHQRRQRNLPHQRHRQAPGNHPQHHGPRRGQSKCCTSLLDPDDVNVSGYVGNTDLHRSNRNDISVTVNGRWIQDSNLSYAIEQGYGNSLPMGRRPIAVLHLVVPPETVDVNAHPTKQEVRFRHESKIFAGIQRAVREGLSSHGVIHQAASRPFGSSRPTELQ